jgi:hypothetical protein
MKSFRESIKQMNLSECIESLRDEYNYANGFYASVDGISLDILADRIHELTRLVPIEERLPTKEDADKSKCVLWYNMHGFQEYAHVTHNYKLYGYTHWKTP